MWQTYSLSLVCMLAFAANSYFCRWALSDQSIDAYSFSLLRILSGALMLGFISSIKFGGSVKLKQLKAYGSWSAAASLSIYALSFSIAYLYLDTGTGALVLFSAVQLSILGFTWWQGVRFSPMELLGCALAFSGFVYLMLPQLSQPSLLGFVLMSISGIAWASYTLIGRSSQAAILDTCSNFARGVLILAPLVVLFVQDLSISLAGSVYAILSGALASACGYALWYSVLPQLKSQHAAVFQLSVPILAAGAGSLMLGENVSQRFIWASLATLGGILLVILSSRKSNDQT